MPWKVLLVAGDHREVRVTGSYVGMACSAIGASAERRGMLLRVTVEPRFDICEAIDRQYAYEAVLLGLTPGEYQVEITHINAVDPHRSYRAAVRVP